MTDGQKGRGVWSFQGIAIGLAVVVVLTALWEWQGWPTVWRYVVTLLVVVAWFGLRAALDARRNRRLPTDL